MKKKTAIPFPSALPNSSVITWNITATIFRFPRISPRSARKFRSKRRTARIKPLKLYYTVKLKLLSNKTYIQIPAKTQIGEGFYIGHSGRVIIHPDAKIGKNVNVSTGVTIGFENRGARKGAPIIADNCWIGANSVIVGNVKIGEDVMIAPLTFVNFDVPAHSIVIGNPAKIIYKENATKDYIQNKV